ncbi:MAG: endolytic transglycosylase MltG [Proteobacteria bacterium]|nr:endolytic transglycosylase MltG [Pseudomonadota bacterium]
MTWEKKLAKLWNSLSNWFKERTVDLLITLAGIGVVFSATGYVHFLVPPSWERHSKVVTIQAGMGFRDIARILEENGIVRDRRSFYLLARMEEVIPKVKAGEYEMNTGMTPGMVLSKLMRGDVIKYPITIPEGFNLFQIGEVLHHAGVCSKKDFMEKVKDSSLVASLGLEGDNLEGYLFPDTYNFPKGLGEELAIRQMVARFKNVYTSLAKRAEQLGLSRKDVVILASMIEKEAADDQERRLIAAVFHNRLQRGMALQSDPTAVYGLKTRKAKNEKITKRDLLQKTPYNTYQISGLPKGPIANPGFKSLYAVLYPADVSYLYFVSKNDRTHYFSHTLDEHNRAVAKYQRRSKRDLKKKTTVNPSSQPPAANPSQTEGGVEPKPTFPLSKPAP